MVGLLSLAGGHPRPHELSPPSLGRTGSPSRTLRCPGSSPGPHRAHAQGTLGVHPRLPGPARSRTTPDVGGHRTERAGCSHGARRPPGGPDESMRAMRRTLAVAMLLALAACSRVVALPSAVVRIDTADGPVRIHAEVAETDAARSRGLAGRTSLAPGEGMAFVTDHPVDDAFWMKRMAIPLSVAFLGRD